MTIARKNNFQVLWIAVFLLLLVFASRVVLIDGMTFHQDEARSAMRMFGTPAQIVSWQPPAWSPFQNLILMVWKDLAGGLPASLRYLSLLFFMLSIALTYRVTMHLFRSQKIAWSVVLVYVSLGLSIYLSIFVRGYIFAMALFPLTLWLTCRYFEEAHWRRAIPLAVSIVLMFYSTYTSLFAFLSIGLFTLIRYPRAIWHWWMPIVIALPLALPELIRNTDFIASRTPGGKASTFTFAPFSQLIEIYKDYFGQNEILWLVLVFIALGIFFLRGRPHYKSLIWIVLVAGLFPILAYVMAGIGIFHLFAPRYTWWVLIIIALGIGYGISYLPRFIWMPLAVILLAQMFSLNVGERYQPFHVLPFEENFRWLAENVQAGDALLVDPNFCIVDCNEMDSWGYYYQVYVGDKLETILEPDEHRRIWYVRGNKHDESLENILLETRIATIFVGPPDFLIRLYEAPPDVEGVLFENGMRFHGFEVIEDGQRDYLPYNWREQTSTTIRLWWSIDEALDADYSVSLQFVDAVEGGLLTQNDGAPQVIHTSAVDTSPTPSETSQWEIGRYYVDERLIEFPDLTLEAYTDLVLTVYQWWDGVRLSAPGVNTDTQLPLTSAVIWGWG